MAGPASCAWAAFVRWASSTSCAREGTPRRRRQWLGSGESRVAWSVDALGTSARARPKWSFVTTRKRLPGACIDERPMSKAMRTSTALLAVEATVSVAIAATPCSDAVYVRRLTDVRAQSERSESIDDCRARQPTFSRSMRIIAVAGCWRPLRCATDRRRAVDRLPKRRTIRLARICFPAGRLGWLRKSEGQSGRLFGPLASAPRPLHRCRTSAMLDLSDRCTRLLEGQRRGCVHGTLEQRTKTMIHTQEANKKKEHMHKQRPHAAAPSGGGKITR